jgi:cytochrome oxidase Cu insertion factor (SCO1/SenC/PrrC family)
MHNSKPRLLIASSKAVRRGTVIWISAIVVAAASLAFSACDRSSHESGVYPVTYHAGSLPDVMLTNQYGQPVSLTALKGNALLFDFIYTSCPGPCQLLTQHMKLIANRVGPELGRKVWFISVTVDPEHDHVNRLFDYAKALDANVKGWYFLTGSSAQIDELMRGFRLGRSRASDGEINHILGYFLVDPEGHEIVDYSQRADASRMARDAQQAANSKTLISWLRANLRQL